MGGEHTDSENQSRLRILNPSNGSLDGAKWTRVPNSPLPPPDSDENSIALKSSAYTDRDYSINSLPQTLRLSSPVEEDDTDNADLEDLLDGHDLPKPKVYREVIVVTVALFQGYAILVLFQQKLAKSIGIRGDNDPRMKEFHFAVSFLYIGNLLFRLLHNFVFAWMPPRRRVYVSMFAMMISMLIISVLVYVIHLQSMIWIYIAYILGGVGVGSFEANLISTITPLGHDTKVWAIMGLPIGFGSISICGFLLTSVGVPDVVIFLIVLAGLVLGSFIYFQRIPVLEIKNNANTWNSFLQNLKQFPDWFPSIGIYCFALMLDMAFVALFAGVMLYVFNNDKYVPLFGPDSSVLINHDLFLAIYNLFTMLGDTISRKVAYACSPRHPLLYIFLSVGGALACMSKIAIIAPVGAFLIFYANGSIYASTTKHIDSSVRHEFNLVALSVWLFIGDIGSVVGSNLIGAIQKVACKGVVENNYVCLGD